MAYFTRNILRMEGKAGADPRGKVWVDPGQVTSPFPWVNLDCHVYNYNIDGNVLKDEHEKWLLEQLCPIVKLGGYHVELHGHASHSGDAKYNRGLSLQRVLLLKEFLLEKGGLSEAQVPGERMRAFGEQFANPNLPEDELDRGVNILIRPGLLVLPSVPIRIGTTTLEPPPDKTDETDKTTTEQPPSKKKRKKFWARYVFGMQGGSGNLGTAQHWFEIRSHDDLGQPKRRFMLSGPMMQIPSPIVGAATLGTREEFSFECPLESVDALAGRHGMVTGVGGGNNNPFFLDIPDCGVGMQPFPTGQTIGFGADRMIGKFIRDTSYEPPPST
ncbi:MAG: hypothetical protein HY000_23390 [Planctomycetes bacterium]|nr:hypothetical protein [Planctomycetota bacterium]